MDKNAIKKFAVWARRELIEKVSQKALQYGIEDEKELDVNLDSLNGILFTEIEKKQRIALVEKIRKEGYSQVIEEVAYTWFNRFVALRFMEVNGYLPSHIRIFTDDENNFKPQILSEALHIEFDSIDKEKIMNMKQLNQDDELYKYLLIAQCNELSKYIPNLFQKLEDYTELLLPDYLLRDGSVVEQMISMIDESDWTDQIQIIGWMYQFYNTEPKDEIFASLKNNVKIDKKTIPAATQIFTPDWIVKYMVENSVGRVWLEGHPSSDLKGKWHYYIDECNEKATAHNEIKPEDIRCFDPCMGSGHILVYLFDVLLDIYEEYGYSRRDAAVSILKNNLYGLDIDKRAAQLASFALTMKARQNNRRLFSDEISMNLSVVHESNGVSKDSIEYFCNGNESLKTTVSRIIELFNDAGTYGSAIRTGSIDWKSIDERMAEIETEQSSLFKIAAEEELYPIFKDARILSNRYTVTVTNPPYMILANATPNLNNYIKKNYPDSKADMFAVFIERCGELTEENGIYAMITQQSFFFLAGFEKLRNKVLNTGTIINAAHMGLGAFGNDFGTVAFVIRNRCNKDFKGEYIFLGEKKSVEEKEALFLEGGYPKYYHCAKDFQALPNTTFSYTISEHTIGLFDGAVLGDTFVSGGRNKTHNDEKYLRFHWEVQNENNKWTTYGKGGEFRKWYGNQYYVVDWSEEAKKEYASHGGLCNSKFWGKKGITWSFVTSYKPSFRYKEADMIYSSVSPTIFRNDFEVDYYVLGLLNSTVGLHLLNIISSTIGTNVGEVLNFPLIRKNEERVVELVKENIRLAKEDWNSVEISMGFTINPLLKYGKNRISDAYKEWEHECANRFDSLKRNEEVLNRLFIEAYGLENEVDAEVEDRDIEASTGHASLERDIKNFISYSVGCMLGRYDYNSPGNIYFDNCVSDIRDEDNIIPLTTDEYFNDDIVTRFEEFVKTVFGEQNLEENLSFISEAIGYSGNARNGIRKYFVSDFYKDHCKLYQKRPIYWQFDSGKDNGFKCLSYIHRYKADLMARIRTDYIHELQARYKTKSDELIRKADEDGKNVSAKKALAVLNKQQDEIHKYEEKIHHLADQMLEIEMDAGVKANYEVFKTVLTKIK